MPVTMLWVAATPVAPTGQASPAVLRTPRGGPGTPLGSSGPIERCARPRVAVATTRRHGSTGVVVKHEALALLADEGRSKQGAASKRGLPAARRRVGQPAAVGAPRAALLTAPTKGPTLVGTLTLWI